MNQRYYSLDVFRGATVALMILVNNPGSWGHIYAPFKHATWHGCTPTDLVFPFFLFAVGNAMAFVMDRFRERGNALFWRKVVKRTILIFAIGFFLNWNPFFQWKDNVLVFKDWETIRIFGVLQRIALCYFFASLIVYYCKLRSTLIISGILLLGYWLLCYLLGTDGDPYSLTGYFGTGVDKAVLGANHMYKGEGVAFDPEGLTSTMAAIVQVVFGYYAGKYIKEKGKTWEMLSHVFIAGAILVFVGLFWNMAFPINKKIWTSSFVLYTVGIALMVLGSLIYLIEFKNAAGKWSRFFDVFGKNPLFIFFLSGFLPRLQGLIRWVDHVDEQGKPVYITSLSWFYEYVCKPLSANLKFGSLVFALSLVAFYWLIGYVLDRKKMYIKV
jgi:predicted acyltransferase